MSDGGQGEELEARLGKASAEYKLSIISSLEGELLITLAVYKTIIVSILPYDHDS